MHHRCRWDFSSLKYNIINQEFIKRGDCNEKGYPIEKLAVQYSTSLNPRIATTLFSSANPVNVLKNISYVNEPVDMELVAKVRDIIGDQMRVRWKNS